MKDLASPQKPFNERTMVQLSIDTCNSQSAVALSRWESGQLQLVAQDVQHPGRGHAEILTVQIGALLGTCNLKPADIGRIAVTKGPGSFTGQRVGLAAARVFAASLVIDAVGVGVLDALLLEATMKNSSALAFCAINDARRGAAYIKALDQNGGVLIDDQLIPVDSLSDTLAALPTPLCLIGSGLSLLMVPNVEKWRCIETSLPDIASVARLGHMLNPGEHPAEPLYLRGADAKPQSAKHVLRSPLRVGSDHSGATL